MADKTRYCRYCRKTMAAHYFDDRARCRRCTRKGRGETSVKVEIDGWTTNMPGLPEMTLPTQEETRRGYQGVVWRADREDWALEVCWHGDRKVFRCRSIQKAKETESPVEARTFCYPHEVVDWVAAWIAQLSRAS